MGVRETDAYICIGREFRHVRSATEKGYENDFAAYTIYGWSHISAYVNFMIGCYHGQTFRTEAESYTVDQGYSNFPNPQSELFLMSLVLVAEYGGSLSRRNVEQIVKTLFMINY